MTGFVLDSTWDHVPDVCNFFKVGFAHGSPNALRENYVLILI